jgi:hypothetical protein
VEADKKMESAMLIGLVRSVCRFLFHAPARGYFIVGGLHHAIE